MDIVSGLTAAKLAWDLAKDLRQIDQSVDAAAFRTKIVDLMDALTDARQALIEAKERMIELEEELKTYKEGDICPKCRTGRLEITGVRPHQSYTNMQFHDSRCSHSTCDYSNTRVYNADAGRYGRQK